MDLARILTIDRYHKAIEAHAKNPTEPFVWRELVIWQIACCLIKGRTNSQAAIHAPYLMRKALLAKAKKRVKRMQNFANHRPEDTKRICDPYIAEYARRAQEKAERLVLA